MRSINFRINFLAVIGILCAGFISSTWGQQQINLATQVKGVLAQTNGGVGSSNSTINDMTIGSITPKPATFTNLATTGTNTFGNDSADSALFYGMIGVGGATFNDYVSAYGSPASGIVSVSNSTSVPTADTLLIRFTNDNAGPTISFRKGRGTASSGTIVQSGDGLGNINFAGISSSSTVTSAARISSNVDGTPGATNDMPGRLVFFTTPDNSGTLTEAFRISSDQTARFASSVRIGSGSPPVSTLDVTGTIATSVAYNTSKLLVSTTAPTISSGFGTSPTIASNNGTATFRVNVGTGGIASSGVVGLPTAANGWNCNVDAFNPSATQLLSRTVLTATTSTTATVQNELISTGAATAWPASQVLILICVAY